MFNKFKGFSRAFWTANIVELLESESKLSGSFSNLDKDYL
jgi:hypothetical protein